VRSGPAAASSSTQADDAPAPVHME
jgi:hypothetical protein